MAPRTILAVAIGDSRRSKLIKDANPATLNGVRPYITGLIKWLSKQPDPPTPNAVPNKYQIGDAKDYVIDYRECDETQLKNTFTVSDVILCMSTTVAREAKSFTKTNNIPVVAIVSDPLKENFPANFCGVSAQRPQHAPHSLKKFKEKAKKFQYIYALHKDGYDPSEVAKGWLGNGRHLCVGKAARRSPDRHPRNPRKRGWPAGPSR